MTVERPITNDDPDVSVVIPTIPSHSHAEVVECLTRQTHAPFEVLVVNDESLDICEARNEGVCRAAAEVVALTDDDCRPPEDWIERIHERFAVDRNLVCLEGAVRGGRTYDGSRMYVGCNLSFDRQAAIDIGGFRSEYAGWRDDTEFGWRMERDGDGECAFDESVAMVHPARTRARIGPERERLLRAEYPERYEELVIPETVVERVNDWLWRNGVWNAVDRIRYRELL